MSVRTSLSHPLRIDSVAVPGGGRLGLTFCPGKKQQLAMTGAWDRDLALDLRAVEAWGAKGVLTLLEPAELVSLGVPQLGQAVAQQGMSWHHIYLPNDAVPDAAFMQQWQQGRGAMHQHLSKGESLVIHCMGGIGRTAMAAAMLLTERGMPPQQAISSITQAREGVFCVPEQVDFILRYRPQPLSRSAPSP